jgi:hypothetical protein
LAIAEISGLRIASAVDSDHDPVGADTQNRLQAFLSVIPLDLFALIRLRSTGTAYPTVSARSRHDAVQHRGGQLRESDRIPGFAGKNRVKILLYPRTRPKYSFLISCVGENSRIGDPGIVRPRTGKQTG